MSIDLNKTVNIIRDIPVEYLGYMSLDGSSLRIMRYILENEEEICGKNDISLKELCAGLNAYSPGMMMAILNQLDNYDQFIKIQKLKTKRNGSTLLHIQILPENIKAAINAASRVQDNADVEYWESRTRVVKELRQFGYIPVDLEGVE